MAPRGVAVPASREIPMVPSERSGSTTTSPGTGFATLKIHIDRSTPIQKVLTPPQGTPLEISFTHPDGEATHAKPHRIEWIALNLLAGERLEIQLDTSFPGFDQPPSSIPPQPWFDHLQRLFPTAVVLPSGAFGWELTSQRPSEVSGLATAVKRFTLRKSGPGDRPVLRYNVVFFDANGVEHAIDPQVEVTPDP